MKIKRPLLVGGLGLTASAWMLNIVQHSIFNETTLLSAIALSSGLWWWQRQRQPLLLDLAGVVDEAAVKTAFAQMTRQLRPWPVRLRQSLRPRCLRSLWIRCDRSGRL
ncbi:MAG: hypothetical protein HC839_02765 [Leptolyngbyaceae cyanobacterium RM2_2_21]|nr:hypothetical protein [Leptolyngbyaceae cyanobacterium RM2_2_21]